KLGYAEENDSSGPLSTTPVQSVDRNSVKNVDSLIIPLFDVTPAEGDHVGPSTTPSGVVPSNVDDLGQVRTLIRLDNSSGDIPSTLTNAAGVKVEGMSPLELSNRMSVLTALIVSHGLELNVHYTSLTHSTTRPHTKVKHKMEMVDKLSSELASVKEKHKNVQEECHDHRKRKKLKKSNESLFDDIKKLNDQLVEAKGVAARIADYLTGINSKLAEQENLQNDVTRFLRVDLDHLVRKLLTSDEFNVAFANILTLAINFGVERGMRMGRTVAENTLVEVADLKLPPHVLASLVSSSAPASSSQKTFGHTSTPSASKPKKTTDVGAPLGV
nr:hypothetical protein [Tanacetum cinerariifolium]